MYKISLVIPVFNVEKTLDVAFNSILNQTFGFENIEVIFVDDCSTDNSRNIIENYAAQYENVKLVCLEKNSDAAGKPRNTGIANANADYIMFLDPDDEFYEYSCEFLYNQIINQELDMVSGNYDQYINGVYKKYHWYDKGISESEMRIANIKEKMDLLRLPASVFTKIYRKDFLLENSIKFPEYISSEDLVFNCECLLKANGIFFIDKPIVKYKIREGESKTSIKNKKTLSNYLQSFRMYYDLIYDFDKRYAWYALIILDTFWLKLFMLSEISRSDKIDVLKSAKFLFDEFKKSKDVSPSGLYLEFFELVHKEKYLDAVLLSERIALIYPESRDDAKNIVKNNKEICILFEEFDLKMGGVGSTVVKRANYLANHGYKVTLLNVGAIKNFEFIRNHFYRTGVLSQKVNFINIFEHYSNKNTLNNDFNVVDIDAKPDSVEKIENDDCSVTLNYLSETGDVIRKEMYIDNCRIYDERGLNRDYYTKDGFKYLSQIFKGKNLYHELYDRQSGATLKFDNLNELVYYFIGETCIVSHEKPFIVCDSTSHWYNINGIDKRKAYKIGSMHGNPYLGDFSYGSPINPEINHLKHLNDLDALVVLTDSVKNDLEKEFSYEHFAVIPNFMDSELLDYEAPKKDFNKISIFSRISPEKQMSDAIEAFNMVCENNDDIVLEIYGRALDEAEIEEFDRLKALVEKLNLENRVIFKGFVEDVSEEMQKSLFTLLISQREGLPLALLESMANSTPVISYDINYGPRDVITNGVDGIITEKNNVEELAKEISKLVNDPQLAVEMGINARDKIKNSFSTDVVGLMWEDLFAQVYAIAEFQESVKPLELERKHRNCLSKNKKIKKENKKIKKENNKLKKLNNQMINSHSWKLTKPLRYIVNKIKSIRNN